MEKFTTTNYPILKRIKNGDLNTNQFQVLDGMEKEIDISFKKILKNKNIEYYSKNVYTSMLNNKIIDFKTKNKCVFHIHDDSGIAIIGKNDVFFYDIKVNPDKTIDGFIFPVQNDIVIGAVHIIINGILEDGGLDMLVSIPNIKKHSKYLGIPDSEVDRVIEVSTNTCKNAAVDVINCLVFKQMIETETVIINKNNLSKKKLNKELYVNKTDLNITIIDSSWYREIIRTESFGVRGHFRLQPFGADMKQKKLIWISPFTKNGYHRKAGKTLHEENN